MAINGEPLRTAQVDDGRHIMPGMLGVAAPRRGEIWIVPADPIEEQCPLCVLEWRHGGWRHGRARHPNEPNALGHPNTGAPQLPGSRSEQASWSRPITRRSRSPKATIHGSPNKFSEMVAQRRSNSAASRTTPGGTQLRPSARSVFFHPGVADPGAHRFFYSPQPEKCATWRRCPREGCAELREPLKSVRVFGLGARSVLFGAGSVWPWPTRWRCAAGVSGPTPAVTMRYAFPGTARGWTQSAW